MGGSGDPPVESAVAAPSCSPPSPVVLPATGRRPADSGRLCLDPATTRLDPVPPCPWGFPSDPLGGPPRRPAAVYGGTALGRPMVEGSGFARSHLPTRLAVWACTPSSCCFFIGSPGCASTPPARPCCCPASPHGGHGVSSPWSPWAQGARALWTPALKRQCCVILRCFAACLAGFLRLHCCPPLP